MTSSTFRKTVRYSKGESQIRHLPKNNHRINPDQCASLSLQRNLENKHLFKSNISLHKLLKAPESRGEAWMSWYHLSVSSVTCSLPSFSSCWVNLTTEKGCRLNHPSLLNLLMKNGLRYL